MDIFKLKGMITRFYIFNVSALSVCLILLYYVIHIVVCCFYNYFIFPNGWLLKMCYLYIQTCKCAESLKNKYKLLLKSYIVEPKAVFNNLSLVA